MPPATTEAVEQSSILLTSLEHPPGYQIQKVLGIVSASTVRARFVFRDIIAGFRTLAGGEVKEYTELMAKARNIALERLVLRARQMGANAVVGIRFTTSAIGGQLAEVMAYGTAVILEPAPSSKESGA